MGASSYIFYSSRRNALCVIDDSVLERRLFRRGRISVAAAIFQRLPGQLFIAQGRRIFQRGQLFEQRIVRRLVPEQDFFDALRKSFSMKGLGSAGCGRGFGMQSFKSPEVKNWYKPCNLHGSMYACKPGSATSWAPVTGHGLP